MFYQFHKPVTLGKRTYGRGAHDVPEDAARGWFFDALLADGSIVPVEPAKKPQETVKEAGEDSHAPVTAEKPRKRKKGS